MVKNKSNLKVWCYSWVGRYLNSQWTIMNRGGTFSDLNDLKQYDIVWYCLARYYLCRRWTHINGVDGGLVILILWYKAHCLSQPTDTLLEKESELSELHIHTSQRFLVCLFTASKLYQKKTQRKIMKNIEKSSNQIFVVVVWSWWSKSFRSHPHPQHHQTPWPVRLRWRTFAVLVARHHLRCHGQMRNIHMEMALKINWIAWRRSFWGQQRLQALRSCLHLFFGWW